MKAVQHPRTEDLELSRVLHALSDPVRLELVRMLFAEGDLPCSALYLGRPKSSMSHHFKTLIQAGLLRVYIVGNSHRNALRLDDLQRRFPGLMSVILAAPSTEGETRGETSAT